MDRKTREELNSLSKKVFGSERRWQKLMEKGHMEVFTRDREVMVPDINGQLKKKVFTDKKNVAKRYTLEEIRKFMEDALDHINTSAGQP